MSRIKKVLIGALLSALPLGSTQAHDTLPQLFAGCAGRYSAEMEHAWLMNRPHAETLAGQRSKLLALLDAVMTPDQAQMLLNYRIEAKMAQAALLTMADFGTNTARAKASSRLAHHHRKNCERLLLNA